LTLYPYYFITPSISRSLLSLLSSLKHPFSLQSRKILLDLAKNAGSSASFGDVDFSLSDRVSILNEMCIGAVFHKNSEIIKLKLAFWNRQLDCKLMACQLHSREENV